MSAIAFIASACLTEVVGEAEQVESLSEALYIKTGVNLWNNNAFGTGVQIPVCFTVRPQTTKDSKLLCPAETDRFFDCLGRILPPDADSLRRVVRANVEDTWMRYSNVELSGWGECPIDAATNTHKIENWSGIMIRFGDSDVTLGEGKPSSGGIIVQYNDMAIFNGGGLNGNVFNIVHELGHVLGFHHEWERPDWDKGNCPPNNPPQQPGDPDTVQLLRLSLVGNKCLDVFNGGTANGTKVDISTCDDTLPAKQYWALSVFNAVTPGTLKAAKLGNKCLTVAGGRTADSTPVQISDCDGRGSQLWVAVAKGALMNPQSGKCLNDPNGSTIDGTQLEIRVCDGRASEAWDVTPGNTLNTAPDSNSIMQYCAPSSNTGALSPYDIHGLQLAYGRKPRGSIVGYRGQCLNVQGASTANGAAIVAFPCRGQWNDTWLRIPTSDGEQFRTTANNRCPNVNTGVAPNPLTSWDCLNQANERFQTTAVEWRAMGNMCVEAIKIGLQTVLQLQPCNNNATQKWDFFHPVGISSLRQDQIRLNGTNSCVSSKTTNGVLGEALVLKTCSPSDTKQRFSMPGSGLVALSNNTGLCANVSGGTPDPGKAIGLWDGCVTTNPPQNSQFTLRGRIKSLNFCMNIRGSGDPDSIVAADACDASSNSQLWDYYF